MLFYFVQTIKNTFNFKGRARRTEYWIYSMFFILYFIYGYFFVDHLIENTAFLVCYLIVFLALSIPALSLEIRRLHDINLSGWYFFVTMIFSPFALYIAFKDSHPIANKWGENPKKQHQKMEVSGKELKIFGGILGGVVLVFLLPFMLKNISFSSEDFKGTPDPYLESTTPDFNLETTVVESEEERRERENREYYERHCAPKHQTTDDFEAFFNKFSTDKDFQKAHILFPLKATAIYYDEENDRAIEKTEKVEQNQYKFIDLTLERADEAIERIVEGKNASARYYVCETGIMIMYYFEKRNGDWFLVSYGNYSD